MYKSTPKQDEIGVLRFNQGLLRLTLSLIQFTAAAVALIYFKQSNASKINSRIAPRRIKHA